MAESVTAAPGRIFISCRREETGYPAGWLHHRVVDQFGSGQVLKDVDSIKLGDDFVDVISTAVEPCDVQSTSCSDAANRWFFYGSPEEIVSPRELPRSSAGGSREAAEQIGQES